jgi:hypothetical protein
MVHRLVLVALQIIIFNASWAQDAAPIYSEDCYLGHNVGLQDQVETLATTAEGAACRQHHEKNRCEEFKKSLEPENQDKVITCTRRDDLSVDQVFVACGAGVGDFVVDTLTGVVHLISQLPYLPGAILSGLGKAGGFLQKCNMDQQFRDSLFESVAPLYTPEERKTIVKTLSCEGLLETVKQSTQNGIADIDRKKRLHAQFKERYPENDLPPHLQLSPGQAEFQKKYYAAADVEKEKLNSAFRKVWNKVQTQAACYNTAAKIELTCEILTKLATGAVSRALLRSVTALKAAAEVEKSLDSAETAAIRSASGRAPEKGRLQMNEPDRAEVLAKTSQRPSIEELKDYLKDGAGHRVVDTPEGPALQIDFLSRNEKKFMVLANKAIRDGSLSIIDGGTLIGPKVLPSINSLVESAAKSGRTLKITGEIVPKDIMDTFYSQASIPWQEGANKWNSFEIEAFKKSLKDLNFDQCTHRECKFTIKVENGKVSTTYDKSY